MFFVFPSVGCHALKRSEGWFKRCNLVKVEMHSYSIVLHGVSHVITCKNISYYGLLGRKMKEKCMINVSKRVASNVNI